MKRTRAITATLLALTAAACGGDYGDGGGLTDEDFCATALARVDTFMARMETEHPVPDSERYGGTVVIGNYGDMPDGMNALISQDYSSTQHQQFVNQMTLINVDENLEPQPYLAESWEVDDPDRPTLLTFHLRGDVYWHDGEKTDAEDVAFTYVTATNPETAFPNAAFWDNYVRGPEGIEVVDSLTVRLHLRPHAEYLDPFRTLAIMPEHLLGDVPVTQLRQHPFGTRCPVGNGPFVFVEHRPQESWTFKANPAFPEALGGRPYLDRYVYRTILEQTTLLADLLTENIDVYIGPRPEQAPEILAAPNVELLRSEFRQYNFLGWNSRRPQLADPRVRRALTMAIDRGQIVQSLIRGYGEVAHTSVPPFHWGYDPTFADSLRYDPDRARRLLDQAGWSDRDGDGVRENAEGLPFAITIKYNQGNRDRQDIAEILQAQLGRVGVRAQPQVVEYGTLIGQLTDPSRDFDAVIMGWVSELKVDDRDLFHSERVDQPYAWSGTHNAEMDRYLDTLQLVVDRQEAIPLWHAYQAAVLREMPYTFLYVPDRLAAVNKRLMGVDMDIRGDWVNVKDWWIPPRLRRDAPRTAAN